MFDAKFVFLYTDVVMWLLFAAIVLYVRRVLRDPLTKRKWNKVLANRTALAAAAVLSVFFVVALTDSVHFRRALPTQENAAVQALIDEWESEMKSVTVEGTAAIDANCLNLGIYK